jgi:hypothetical protein
MKNRRFGQAFALLSFCLTFTGCGGDNSVSLPANPTAEPPSLEMSTGGDAAKAKGPETNQTRPR